MTLDHENLRELAVAYAFDTLDAAEAAEFRTHLATCAECQQDVRDATRVAEALALMPEAAPLPIGLRDRVLSSVIPARPSAPRRDAPALAARSHPLIGWAIAASLMALVAAGVAWQFQRRSMAALADAERGRQQLVAAQQALALVQERADEAQRALDIVTAADVVRVRLAGQPAAPQAAGSVLWSATRGLLFTSSRLPVPPPGRIYQLWYVTAGAPVSAGLVAPDPSLPSQTLRLPAVPVQPKAFALTLEPSGGVPAPTGAFFLLGSL